MKQIQLTKEEFKKLRAEAGFESEAELAEFLGFSPITLYAWKKKNLFPHYVVEIFASAKKAHSVMKSFNYMEDAKNFSITKEERMAIEKIKKYRVENNKLRAKIALLKNKLKLKE